MNIQNDDSITSHKLDRAQNDYCITDEFFEILIENFTQNKKKLNHFQISFMYK